MSRPFITTQSPDRPKDPVEGAAYDEKLRVLAFIALVEYCAPGTSAETIIRFLLADTHRMASVANLATVMQGIKGPPDYAPEADQQELVRAIDAAMLSLEVLAGLERDGAEKAPVVQ